MEPIVTLAGETFSLVTVQRGTTTAVYRSARYYLRLGERAQIQRDISFHKQMAAYGFPVARIVLQGAYRDFGYFIEESLGEKHFGELFAEDVMQYGKISDRSFGRFLHITQVFAQAQLKTRAERSTPTFAHNIHLAALLEELPQDAARIQARFAQAMERLIAFPCVLTHGDFNPHNLYPAGVIDLEASFYGPAGYDLATNIVHINNYPTSSDYEFFQGYYFTEEQQRQYCNTVDALYTGQGLAPLSAYLEDFAFCRAVWLAVRMGPWPKIQQFRYDLLRQKFLLYDQGERDSSPFAL
jgi:Phosphotransferase enzyme family